MSMTSSHTVLHLSETPPPSHLSSNAIIAIDGVDVTIHLSHHEPLRTIKKAARMLCNLGYTHLKFSTQWTVEQQWAFYNAAVGPQSTITLEWSDGTDTATLNKLQAAFQFAKSLINETPENMFPEKLSDCVTSYLKSLVTSGLTVTKTIGVDLKKAGWNGIYEVGRGSTRPPVLLEIDYNPTGDPEAPISTALVGKGITFDSGGYSIKTNQGMLNMKADMAGAATVAAAMGLAITQGLNKRTRLYLCCAENLISGHAYKLGDIITYKNGTTVEIHNTDAEGRLVLADGLIAASEAGAETIIDAATLTGAALVAVGNQYNALFSMDDNFTHKALNIAKKMNEPSWPLPLTDWHKFNCPSSYADTANSVSVKGGGFGGASNAAGFLSRFVRDNGKGWLHFDLAAAFNDAANQHAPAGGTGHGIRTIAELTLCAGEDHQ